MGFSCGSVGAKRGNQVARPSRLGTSYAVCIGSIDME
jgi:hypothetical protein